MKNIYVFIPSLEYGGAERVVSYLVDYLSEKNYEITLLTSREAKLEYTINRNVRRLIMSNWLNIYRELKNNKPNLAIVLFAPQLVSIFPILRILGIPCITSERNDPRNFSGKKITSVLYKYFLTKAEGVVFQTTQARDYYLEKLKGKYKVIYNPIKVESLPRVYEGKRCKTIVTVGRLHLQKNQELLIRAFAKVKLIHPNYSLEIYGDGPLKEQLSKLINDLNLSDSVFLMGSTPNVLEKIRKSSLFVLTSNFEGMPNALIEALCLGIPTISTDCPVGGPRELISHNENGLLVPMNDENSLLNAMLKVIESDGLKNSLSKEARKLRSQLELEVIMEQWVGFITEILGEQ